jgi:hypothetical protein
MFPYIGTISRILSHLKKKLVKNHNNPNQQIIMKFNKFLHFIITSNPRNAKKQKHIYMQNE